MNAHPFIEAEKQQGHNVKRACELLKVSRTAFYARRNPLAGPRRARDLELAQEISAVHARSHGTYGAPRVHMVLQRQGQRCGRRRVARLMRQTGLQGVHRRRRPVTTVPDAGASTRPDLVNRQFTPDATALNQRWCGDITYIPTDEGWLYLATVIDIASRRVIGWATADHLRTELVADALQAAHLQRRPAHGVIFHADRGCQYTSRALAQLAEQLGVRLSVGRTGQCWDNALAESFFSILKLLHPQARTDQHPHLAHQGRCPQCDLRLHRRLVQPTPTPQQPGLPQPQRLRSTPRSLNNTTNLSVKTEQAHRTDMPTC
ncbi:IS3 family transposase [Streptacidiphilus sp. P02-A3a]|nr:IS3 family transposase [Streptacidiphilus sp. P02-A3a]